MPRGDRHRVMRGRNLALAWFLAALVVLFFVVTIVKMKALP
jgi:hypothetical protein